MLKRSLSQLITLIWCKVLQFIMNTGKQCVADVTRRRALGFGIMRNLLTDSL